MKVFKSHKEVSPTPMSRQDWVEYRGWELPADEDGTDEGYLVEYLDGGKPNHPDHKGYISWSPKEQFDNGYTEVKEDSTFLERLITEECELSERITKLAAFMSGGNVDQLPLVDASLLGYQLHIMRKLKDILGARLERLGS